MKEIVTVKEKITKTVQNVMNKLNEVTRGKAKIVLAAAAVVLVLVIAIIAVSGNPLYKKYKTGELLYNSPLNSAHADLYEEGFEYVKLSGRKFEILVNEEKITIKKPEVRSEEVTEEKMQEIRNAIWGDASKLDLTKIKTLHYIYDSEGKRCDYLLAETDDGMWFVKYYVVNEKMDIWHIIELD